MYWLNEYSRAFLNRGYMREGVEVEDRIKEIADKAEEILGKKGFSQKFYYYMSKGYYSLSSPVWSNFGLDRGLPISCFGSYLGDDMAQILFTHAEVGMMSKYGGGASGYFGDLRSRGSKIKDNGYSSGSVHFMQLFETLLDVVSQGSVRRGHFSPYLPVEHPDIEEFLKIGTEGNLIQKMTHGVTVTDQWLKEMKDGDAEKRAIWAEIIQRRNEMGYPYIMFVDTANKNTVDVYKDKGHKIHASNMCSEIMLPSNENWSFVCNLSSMNLYHYDEWKDTDAVETMVYFLDAVMSDFIIKLEKLRDSGEEKDQQAFAFIERAYNFAKQNRALGLGVLGWHSLLQSKMLPIDSKEASNLNLQIFRYLQEEAYKASEKLAQEYGEPKLLEGYGRRNATLMAIAPTTSSAFILGQVSQSIEPLWSNCYVKDVAKLKVTIRNKHLEDLLERKGYNTKDVWKTIRDNDGSVQHLSILTQDEKEVFKTFQETNQRTLIEQAAVRQRYIDQGQSLNLAINPSTPAKEINELYLYAWELGIKTLYYQHSVNAAQQFARSKQCESCEG
ncbi:ribonucleoside-diphosphate reductase subunit alpha [Candidatus Absconditicoccus praedator]|uniref:ribonucleoside-diphosphate reductase subunit alpha n=1 Tax=Candidatus Absconditicoccus praedator TaxID=2735562 RepID=UPI001E58350A|nr:ribonucleoside-diphosphate reductase subunit alpha [Candidatus Absconditicoccus praedator]UFX82942.1 ribonucleoside-diphosphate reductase subunit alpha [Candidatus Absconditicoccus praedator]